MGNKIQKEKAALELKELTKDNCIKCGGTSFNIHFENLFTTIKAHKDV